MSQRVVRVNELLKREISATLHSRYQSESVGITISEVSVSPDLRRAQVFYTVIGDEADVRDAQKLFARHGREIRRQVGSVIVLKYLPHLDFVHDDSMERGARLNKLLDEMGLEGEGERPSHE